MASKKKGKKKYGAAASRTVKKVMGERKRGSLRSGRSKKKVTSRAQAVAIGLSEARAAGAKVPRKKSSKKAGRKKTAGASANAGGRKKSAKKSSKRSSKKSARS